MIVPRPRLRFLLLSAAAIVGPSACTKVQPRQQRNPVSVAVATAQRTAVPYTIEANGVVTPQQTASVASQVEGMVMQVAFEEGQDVEQGQVLFRVDSRLYEATYAQATSALARDRATADNARKEAERYDLLLRSNVVSPEEAENRRAAAAAAAATVQLDSAAVATAKYNLDNTTIRAPISGRSGSVLVKAGNVVHASGNTPLVVIHQIRPILVRFAVPSTELPLILQYGGKGGLPVSVMPGGTNHAPALGDTARTTAVSAESTPLSDVMAAKQGKGGGDPQGTLSFIDNAVDTSTGTVLLKATFPNTAGTLWVGQFVSTVLRLFIEENALVIPSQAVVTGQRGTYVYIIDSTNTARQRIVAVERTTGGVSIIAAGIQEGDRVVTDGQARLTPDAQVNLRTTSDSVGLRGGGGPGRGPGRGKGRE